ncbi:MAG: hypothetical protein ACTSRU_18365 [Candidatus Hodarchaeales archaeon]
MNEQISILGNTLYREQGLDYGPDNQENYYIPGSGESIHTGDPSDLFGVTDPRGSWGHFRSTTGSTMGYNYQLKRDCRGKTVNRNNVRLARLHDRISRSRSDYHNKMKYIRFTAPLREFFPEQLLGQACQLFEKVQPRLTGKNSDFSCFLACVEFLLIDQGAMIKDGVLSEINHQLDLDISRDSMLKHRLNIKKACVELYGRKETYKRFHRRGGVIVANCIGELIIPLDIDPSTKREIRALSRELIELLATGNYIPKHYTSHAYALMKIACEELGLVDANNWDNYLDLEENIRKSVYAIAYKLKKRLEDLKTSTPETVIEGVISSEVVAEYNKRETFESTKESAAQEIVNSIDCVINAVNDLQDHRERGQGFYLSRQQKLRLLALNIAIGQLTLVSDILPVKELLMLEINILQLIEYQRHHIAKKQGDYLTTRYFTRESSIFHGQSSSVNISCLITRLLRNEFIQPGIHGS